MTLPTSINAYNDVRSILDAAVSAGGGRYELPSEGLAIRWRQRAYKLRKLLWDEGKETQYDDFEFVLDGPIVLIKRKPVHRLTDLDGNELAPAVEDEDELLEEALDLKNRLNLET